MYDGLVAIRRKRAELERNRVLIGSEVQDSYIDEVFNVAENTNYLESVTEEELEKLIDALPATDSTEEELDRILATSEELGADEILDISEDEVRDDYY